MSIAKETKMPQELNSELRMSFQVSQSSVLITNFGHSEDQNFAKISEKICIWRFWVSLACSSGRAAGPGGEQVSTMSSRVLRRLVVSTANSSGLQESVGHSRGCKIIFGQQH